MKNCKYICRCAFGGACVRELALNSATGAPVKGRFVGFIPTQRRVRIPADDVRSDGEQVDKTAATTTCSTKLFYRTDKVGSDNSADDTVFTADSGLENLLGVGKAETKRTRQILFLSIASTVISGFQALRKARAVVVTEGTVQISGWTR
ncbi:hypothetical protein PoB_005489300 [Plakobranchus ocellatus]|uniref:Uncharacterized protein n=1 Tax=Plakobranchus ocellatus TaxID=259542 RepID=A0AAV4C919_9GAST|nr:hypothetical protein PoB_005489300 [Plakobranchus ocellatus]